MVEPDSYALDLPEKFSEIRPTQLMAVEEACAAYDDGANVVIIDAPTGSGKSLIGEMVRQTERLKALWRDERDNHRSIYLCSQKGLQDQFHNDFAAPVIKGRSNYPTEYMGEAYSCDDCMGPRCKFCSGIDSCPYVMARETALRSELCIANYSYFIGEASNVGKFSGHDLAIADECDTLEHELLNQTEFYLSSRRQEGFGVEAPKKGSHKPTVATWLEEQLAPAVKDAARGLNPQDVEDARKLKKLQTLHDEAKRIATELRFDLEGEEDGIWIRDYNDRDDGALIWKPVVVGRYGGRLLWRHARRWLLMSATVISGQQLMSDLGSAMEMRVVSVPMSFPVENRRIHFAPIGSMSRKNYDETLPKMVRAIERIVEAKPGVRVLVHTHTYKLARELANMCRLEGRPVFRYESGSERDDVFQRYARAEGSVLFAPSMDRGFDFAGDLARAVVIAKVPFPYLGDRRVSARQRLPDGRAWYQVQTVRSIVQMTGRGVRSAEDTCESFILDDDFRRTWNGAGQRMYPAWWREALDFTYPSSQLV